MNVLVENMTIKDSLLRIFFMNLIVLKIKMLIFYFMNENKVKQLINSNKNNLSNNQLFLNFYKN